MIGFEIKYSEISAGVPYTRFTTPSGIPASAKHLTRAAVLAGVSSAPLRIIEHPAARADDIFLTP